MKVLIVDDSAFIREMLKGILTKIPGVEAIDAAGDPVAALAKIKIIDPDVITLDVEMPRMDGLTFLERLMADDPRPVVMISSWTAENSEIAKKALSLGAFDCIAKPTLGIKEGMEALEADIAVKVTQAARAKEKVHRLFSRENRNAARPSSQTGPPPLQKFIAIGASTGGIVAITRIMRELPPELPGIVIIQHMPANFSSAFAATLNSQTQYIVKEAAGADRIAAGTALVAPGNRQLIVERDELGYKVRITSKGPDDLYSPSVDTTFFSIAACAGSNIMGVLLTGMGADGARGLLAMRGLGALTVAQDEETSVVYGMPGKAAEYGAAQKILPLPSIAAEIIHWAGSHRR